MSILNAMYAGVSGLNAEGEALGVAGDNIANSNTVGFKQSRAIFEDVLGSAAMHGPGGGVRMARTQQIFAQGALQNTGQATDLALTGDGFFVVKGVVDGTSGNFYTRAGQLTLQKDGKLVNPDGLGVQGYAAQADGSFAAGLSDVTLPTGALAPKSTTEMKMTANLDATATPPALPWDPANPAATSNFSTSMKVFDSLGNAHTVDVYFAKTADGAWDYHALAPGGEVVGGTAGASVEIASGALSFTTSGALQSVAVGSGGTVSFNGATADQPLTFSFGSSIADGGAGTDGLTQYGSPSSVSSQSQNGYAAGDLSGVKIDSDGTVSGVYTNGQKVAVAQIAVAKFTAVDGLARSGHNLFAQTRESGEASLGPAGSGGRGAIAAGALEQSNVDIATQFVDLIAHQRSFQANSKTITTADEMLQQLMNLKQ